MILISQDRNKVYLMQAGEQPNIYTVIKNNVLMGFNLMLYGKLLGTFYIYDEAEKEMDNINDCKEETYLVKAFNE